MFFFFFDNKLEIKLGASPKEADVAIVSINSAGTIGELNKMVLKDLGYDETVLRKVDVDKGFGHYEGESNKLILFVVTVGRHSTENNLSFNLLNCLEAYHDVIQNKKVWIPLMGTGAGGLSLQLSFSITKKVIEQFFEKFPKNNCRFLLSIPNSNDGKILYNQTEKEHNKLEIDHKEPSTQTERYINENVLKLIRDTNYKFYLVGSNWDSQGDQSDRFYKDSIWENGYGEEKFGNRVNKVEEGDILLNKSTYAKQDGTNYLRIKGIAIVTKNPKNSSRVYCNWIIKNIKIDITDLSYYRDTISEPSDEGLITILSNLDENSLREIYRHISVDKQFSPFMEIPKGETKIIEQDNEVNKAALEQNITTLAGLVSDADSGTDYLEISKDVNAFARVMAAKSFEPPLAIALLGKWGSGKSFFMRKLKEGIQNLSEENPEKQFCEGIAHVHFNAWSYMDANLWACFVTRIFESLDDYIKDTFDSDKEIKHIENQLFNKLNVSKEQLSNLKKQKESIDQNIQKLTTRKDRLKTQLDRKVLSIKTKTLTDIFRKVNEEFNVRNQIEKTLDENPTFVETKEKFIKIVPEKYWDNPTEFYNQLKSGYSFLKAFFHRDSICKNILWITAILLILALTPVFTYVINLLIIWQDFTLTNGQWFTISIIGSTIVRGIDTFIKLKKQIAPFWKIKEDYEATIANAIFEFEQEEKGLRLEIDNFRQEILQIDNQIQLNKEIKATLEFKLKNALSTEALYTFIEKRANSDDYKKHLGIVSLIRKDFEILSGLLTGHQTELVSNKESKEFKELFGDRKALERIVLYIDDLDRCPEERVVEVLEAVNLLMAFPLFVVVVGVDPRWVKNALIKKHHMQFTGHIGENENKEIEIIEASSYLEKIFQVPFHLKDAEDKSIKGMIKTLAKTKPNLIVASDNNDYDSNDYDSNDYNTEKDNKQKTNDENELKTISITPSATLFNKETIEALDITDKESELLQNMSEVIGNNPRAVKRFVNIYRIVKTHEEFNFNAETKEVELSVVMFLLALPMGKFKILMKSFEEFLDEKLTIGFETLEEYFNSEHLNDDYKDADLLQEKRKEVFYLLSEHSELLAQDVAILNKHYDFIKRFTFKNI